MDTSNNLPQDPLLEQVITPLTMERSGWTEIEELRVDAWHSWRRQRPGEREHFVVTYKHRVCTITLLQPRGPRS